MKHTTTTLLLLAGILFSVSAKDVAIFPVVGINADKSFLDAFGVLLSRKYEAVSGKTVIDPLKSGRSVGEDSDFVAAAKRLGVSEYIEITAVGLYLSLKEKYSYSNAEKVVIHVNEINSDDEEDSDQELLDNSKTIVTAIRKDSTGRTIHKVELTLLTYGDIEETCDRFANALYRKVSIDEARSLANVTRREGMGNNKLFSEKIHGIKVGGYYPYIIDDHMSTFTSIGYNLRMESSKFFIEFGANGRFPSALFDDTKRSYGGLGLEVGGSYIFTDGIFGVYAGGGVIPHFNFVQIFEMGLAPYLQFGITFPRNSSTRFFIDIRVAQNVLPVSSGWDESDYYYDDPYYEEETSLPYQTNFPCEIGLNFGIGW
jgi:hypothetical protein